MNNRTRGFTLIELSVVVLIVGILAAVAVPQYQKAVMKSRLTEIQTFINAVDKAASVYFLQHGAPATTTRVSWDVLDIDLKGMVTCTTGVNGRCTSKDGSWGTDTEMSIMPTGWRIYVGLKGGVLGGGELYVDHSIQNSSDTKTCRYYQANGAKGKIVCDILKQQDDTWSVEGTGC